MQNIYKFLYLEQKYNNYGIEINTAEPYFQYFKVIDTIYDVKYTPLKYLNEVNATIKADGDYYLITKKDNNGEYTFKVKKYLIKWGYKKENNQMVIDGFFYNDKKVPFNLDCRYIDGSDHVYIKDKLWDADENTILKAIVDNSYEFKKLKERLELVKKHEQQEPETTEDDEWDA